MRRKIYGFEIQILWDFFIPVVGASAAFSYLEVTMQVRIKDKFKIWLE
jgi:hypothetical protein